MRTGFFYCLDWLAVEGCKTERILFMSAMNPNRRMPYNKREEYIDPNPWVELCAELYSIWS